MWYPQILNSMSELGKKLPENQITMCKAVLYDDDMENMDNYFIQRILSYSSNNATNRALMVRGITRW